MLSIVNTGILQTALLVVTWVNALMDVPPFEQCLLNCKLYEVPGDNEIIVNVVALAFVCHVAPPSTE